MASAAASDANSSSNSPGRDEERDEAARREKEEKAAASLLLRSQKYAMLKQQLAVAAQFEVGDFARKSWYKLAPFVHLKLELVAGLQGGREAEGFPEVVRGGGAGAAPTPVDEEGNRGGTV